MLGNGARMDHNQPYIQQIISINQQVICKMTKHQAAYPKTGNLSSSDFPAVLRGCFGTQFGG